MRGSEDERLVRKLRRGKVPKRLRAAALKGADMVFVTSGMVWRTQEQDYTGSVARIAKRTGFPDSRSCNKTVAVLSPRHV